MPHEVINKIKNVNIERKRREREITTTTTDIKAQENRFENKKSGAAPDHYKFASRASESTDKTCYNMAD